MDFVLVTPPAVEPLTLQQAKDHLRVDHSDDDSLIEPLISAARQVAEIETRSALITQTWDLVLDDFPGGADDGSIIRVPRPPLQSVTWIHYTDLGNVTQTVDSSVYLVDTVSQPGRIGLAYSKFWPTVQSIINGVRVRFVAGYGDTPEDVPAPIRQAMLLMIGDWYANRESIGPTTLAELPRGAKALLAGQRTML